MLAILTVLKGVSAVSGLFRLIPLVCWTSSIISYGASNALAAYAEEHKQGDGRAVEMSLAEWAGNHINRLKSS